jgi:hypothetical protein
MLTYSQNEMKTAKQQAQDLDQTNNFFKSLLSTDNTEGKLPPSQVESTSSRLVNGKPKLPKIDAASRYSDPPAPPPQQPLPEKPDMVRSSPSEGALASSFKRNETARSVSGMGGSPTHQQSGQILSLVEALSSAKKELDSQGARVKYLEDMLRQERSARESAEERARRLEQSASYKPVSSIEHALDECKPSGLGSDDVSTEHVSPRTNKQGPASDAPLPEETISSEGKLQLRLDQMVAEMDKMRQDMHEFQHRAEVAEANATTTRASLAEMIERLRRENEEAAEIAQREVLPAGSELQPSRTSKNSSIEGTKASMTRSLSKHQSTMPNGHLQTSPKLPKNLERAMATVLRTDSDGQLLAQSAPYASMLGVVLLGVGLMAYLNSWQKMEK